MRSPKKPKSSRRPCPLGIDCDLVAAQKGKACPNREHCEDVAAPWALPYTRTTLEDGTKILMVTHCRSPLDLPGSRDYETWAAGWRIADRLPFKYIRIPDLPQPILLVTFNLGTGSYWGDADTLGEKYAMWAACRAGMSYPEFQRTHFDYNEYYYYGFPVVYDPLSDYPHCILPPDY